ncbi:MAG: hypothetical protein ACLQOZ_01825 [Acidimicrobiales bacterium]
MTADPTTTADWLTAFGTVGAVLVALGLSIVPGIRRRLRRPKLQFEFGNTEPLTRIDLSPTERAVIGGGFNGDLLVRAMVRNGGRSEARRVRVQVQAWWVAVQDHWGEFDLDPVLLRWVSEPSETEVDIAPQLHDLVEVVSKDRSGRHRLAIPLDPLPHFDWQSSQPYQRHRIELVAYGDGAESSRVVIEYGFNEHGGIDLKESQRPSADEIQKLGFMSLVGGLRFGDEALEAGGVLPTDELDE